MIAALIAALASFAVLAAVFVPLERLFPARKQPVLRKSFALDACFFFGQYLVWTSLAVSILRCVPKIPVHFTQPTWLLAIECVLLGDMLVYWFHRACHRFDFLWRIHAVHHSAEHLDWLAAHREHPLDGIATQLCQNLPAILLGLRLEALAGLVVFRAFWAIFVHSNVALPLGFLRWIVGSPELHHWHHARTSTHNFANLAPWIDLLFGTHHFPSGTYEIGSNEPLPATYAGQLLWPFSSLLPRVRRLFSAFRPPLAANNPR